MNETVSVVVNIRADVANGLKDHFTTLDLCQILNVLANYEYATILRLKHNQEKLFLTSEG